MKEKLRPQAFLLTCWMEGTASPNAKPYWRYSLKEIGKERRQYGFSDVDKLLTFLKQRTDSTPSQDKGSP